MVSNVGRYSHISFWWQRQGEILSVTFKSTNSLSISYFLILSLVSIIEYS